ncbi:class II fructose-bisphosphate aldolase [Spirochaetales bacterium NM-380-WT-3C1]|uniref:Class II fructose-bisphosphate aldolase n=1 Tax=Bullifex porci TaxID=2606638 RepID=A0A7X2PBI8_9SPIO|nr:class II fructose-bisphosphate aldolase [Bullifex porci]MSU05849.1 class II fructose-bisphosphate aldolase [Bullifex porci]
MSLVRMDYVLKKAQKGGYAVGAFNFPDLSSIQGIMQGAAAKNSPVIISPPVFTMDEMGEEMCIRCIETLTHEYPEIDVVCHLDHCSDFERIKRCIDYGFTSVMVDGSALPYDQNVELTCKVVDYASRFGVSVEAELGHIGGVEEDIVVDERKALFTQPKQALEFVKATGIDALAIAVGTAHGFYKQKPKLDFERIAEIRAITDCCLVLHGGSGVPDEDFKKAISLGITKINVGTELKITGNFDVQKALFAEATHGDVRKIQHQVRIKTQEIVEHKIDVFGSAGKMAQ